MESWTAADICSDRGAGVTVLAAVRNACGCSSAASRGGQLISSSAASGGGGADDGVRWKFGPHGVCGPVPG